MHTHMQTPMPHVQAHAHAHTQTHTHTHTPTRTRLHAQPHTHTPAHARTCARTRARIRTDTHARPENAHARANGHTHAHAHSHAHTPEHTVGISFGPSDCDFSGLGTVGEPRDGGQGRRLAPCTEGSGADPVARVLHAGRDEHRALGEVSVSLNRSAQPLLLVCVSFFLGHLLCLFLISGLAFC